MSRSRGEAGASGIHVGTGKAHDSEKLYGKVRAYAKERGWNPPPDEKEVKQGYRRLLSVDISHPDFGTKSIIPRERPKYLKLTNVGQRLVIRIHTDSELKNFAKEQAGLNPDQEPEPKWPIEYDEEEATILLEPTEELPTDEETFELPTRAQFECSICGKDLCHTYSFEWPTEAWSKTVTKTCEDCDTELEHEVGNPHSSVNEVP